jgi:hypothetical protein
MGDDNSGAAEPSAKAAEGSAEAGNRLGKAAFRSPAANPYPLFFT